MHRLTSAVFAVLLVSALAATAQQIRRPPKPWVTLQATRPFRFAQLRFSPNGQYILAQDDRGVTVLSTQPLQVLFQAPSRNVVTAIFTPDSSQMLFVSAAKHDDIGRLERWSISNGHSIESNNIPLADIGTAELSPDGRIVASVDRTGTLRIEDIATGEVLYQKKKFAQRFVDWNQGMGTSGRTGYEGAANLRFSPDGHVLLGFPTQGFGPPTAFDLPQRKPLKLAGRLRKLKHRSEVAFVGPDRLLISQDIRPFVTVDSDCKGCQVSTVGPGPAQPARVTAAVLTVPTGEVLSTALLPPGPVFPTANPAFVRITPLGVDYNPDAAHSLNFPGPPGERTTLTMYPMSNRAAAVEFATGRIIVSQTPALDVFGNLYVAELPDGEVGLHDIRKGLLSSVALPN